MRAVALVAGTSAMMVGTAISADASVSGNLNEGSTLRASYKYTSSSKTLSITDKKADGYGVSVTYIDGSICGILTNSSGNGTTKSVKVKGTSGVTTLTLYFSYGKSGSKKIVTKV